VNIDELRTVSKSKIVESAKKLDSDEVSFLVKQLSLKDDTLRYNAFLLLQAHSRLKSSIYAYWDVLMGKLESDNSYQRSIGAMLIAENVCWDTENKFKSAIPKYFACCTDEKFITSRQAIQGLATILAVTDRHNDEIKIYLMGLQVRQYKENQQKLLKKDIANVLKAIK
jgi:hypothetical protein